MYKTNIYNIVLGVIIKEIQDRYKNILNYVYHKLTNTATCERKFLYLKVKRFKKLFKNQLRPRVFK